MRIQEVSKLYGLSADTLRYYERIKLIPVVPRNAGGIRDYDEVSLQWIEFIKCMRGAGLPIEKLITYVELYQQGDETIDARKQLLIEERDHLLQRMNELQATLERLNEKIERYENGNLNCKLPGFENDNAGE
ncbi:MAG: MerR family transcriptional regulator [Erysipelotrichaceae bacterium]|nr:MerR family transcriptional regulator [Erysipelotrichaceae bacterium]